MIRKKKNKLGRLLWFCLALVVWATAYIIWPRYSFDDGPFYAEPFAFDIRPLPVLSTADLSLFGMRIYTLESRVNLAASPGTVFVLKSRSGKVQWAKRAGEQFGPIHLAEFSARWFLPGGWVIGIKPERTESGVMYISPLGRLRFFFHSW